MKNPIYRDAFCPCCNYEFGSVSQSLNDVVLCPSCNKLSEWTLDPLEDEEMYMLTEYVAE